MRSPDILNAVLHRLQRRSTWVAALLFGSAWLGMRAIMGLPFEGFGLGETVVPLVLLLGTLLLGPVPWQWTGDAASLTPFLRGLLQAIPWNAAWIVLGLALLSGLGVPVGPRGNLLSSPPPPRREGPPPPRPRDGERPPPPEWGRLDPAAPGRPGGPERDRLEPTGPSEATARRTRPLAPGPLNVGLTNLPLVMLLGWFLADRERSATSERAFQRLAEEARSAALQAQMHPHALFNALSGLSELVHEDPDAAEEALLELSRMMRLLLHQTNHQLLPLRDERELIRSYLTLEKIRLGALLAVQWEWPEGVDGLAFPPLLLMPLVENAIKHGISQHPQGGQLSIQALREEDTSTCACPTPGPPTRAPRATAWATATWRSVWPS
ncbi:MAG: histidine kinase [Holophagaceae bacterium]|nr:histidine kinase [Holophagaceae bacterium]